VFAVIERDEAMESFVSDWIEEGRQARIVAEREAAMGEGYRTLPDIHDPDCECGICQENDRLGYDADVSDPRQYCRHGTFIGSWWGPDYLCSMCESGEEPSAWWMEAKLRKARINSVRPRDRVGAVRLRDIVKRMYHLMETEAYTERQWQKRSTDDPKWKLDGLRDSKDCAKRAVVEQRYAFALVLTDNQFDWLLDQMRSWTKKTERQDNEVFEAAHPGLIAEFEKRWGKKESRRIDPLEYYEPRISPSQALDRQDAIQAYLRNR